MSVKKSVKYTNKIIFPVVFLNSFCFNFITKLLFPSNATMSSLKCLFNSQSKNKRAWQYWERTGLS